jgi:hypothetical protein
MKPIYLLIALIILSSPTNATVIGVTPGSLTFENTTRGGEYTNFLTASTTDKKITLIATPTGQTKDWITFGQNQFEITGGTQLRLPVKVIIPENTPNGEYQGTIELRSSPSNELLSGTGMNIGAAVYIKIYVKVSGSEGIMFRVLKTTANNAKEGEPIKAEIIAKNNGQTQTKPTIILSIISTDRKNTYHTQTITNESIEPLSKKTLTESLPTTGIPPGIYSLDFDISLEGQSMWSSQETFYILSAQQTNPNLKLEGLLENTLLSNANLTLGETLTISGKFNNTGDAPLDAKLKIEIIKDGRTINTKEGPNMLINVSEEKELQINYKPLQPGEYTIKTWVEYSGQQTTTRIATIRVWEISKPLFGLDQNFYLIAFPIMALIVLWLIFYYREYYQRRE